MAKTIYENGGCKQKNTHVVALWTILYVCSRTPLDRLAVLQTYILTHSVTQQWVEKKRRLALQQWDYCHLIRFSVGYDFLHTLMSLFSAYAHFVICGAVMHNTFYSRSRYTGEMEYWVTLFNLGRDE